MSSSHERGDTAQSKGGRVRAAIMSQAERSSVASKAAQARWSLPRATHSGEIALGPIKIPCAVLEDGRRLLTQEGFLVALGRSKRPDGSLGSPLEGLPPFLAAKNLKPFISEELERSSRPVQFRTKSGGGSGGGVAWGYPAELLPRICGVYLDADDKGVLTKSQEHIGKSAKVLVRALAGVAIVALVDEATGYQYDRARDDLQRLLEQYVREEMRPWVPRFPQSFFQEIYRLRGWKFAPGMKGAPRYIGKLINRYVYDCLPEGVHKKLKEINPVTESGRRRHKHHQFLTEHTGEPHLDKQIAVITTLMRIAKDRYDFDALFLRAFPQTGDQMSLRVASGQSSDKDEEE